MLYLTDFCKKNEGSVLGHVIRLNVIDQQVMGPGGAFEPLLD